MNVRPLLDLALLGALALASPAQAAEARRADDQEANRALARRVFDEILNQGRFEVFDEIYSPDFLKHIDAQVYSLSEEIEQARATRALAADLVVAVEQLIADGDRVAIVYTGRGTNTGSFAGLAPSGKSFEIRGATVYRFAGGRIVEEWTFYNELEILRQLGYEPGPPVARSD